VKAVLGICGRRAKPVHGELLERKFRFSHDHVRLLARTDGSHSTTDPEKFGAILGCNVDRLNRGKSSLCATLLLCSALLLTRPLAAHEDHHQQIELTKNQIGAVHFSNSCSASVQESFPRAVALPHSFAFETAEEQFQNIALRDRHCAIAHWGIAKTYWRWNIPDTAGLKEGWGQIQIARALDAATTRERALSLAIIPAAFEINKIAALP
jgi:hypothetical protein